MPQLLLNSLKLGMTEDMDVVRLPAKYRTRHMMIVGGTGTGKSRFLETLWQQDSFYRYAKVLVDPSGELAKDCLYLSQGNAIYCSLKTPVSLNLMNGDYDIHQISESLRNALNQMITQSSEQNKELTVKMCAIFDRAVTRCLEKGLKIPGKRAGRDTELNRKRRFRGQRWFDKQIKFFTRIRQNAANPMRKGRCPA